MAKKKAIKKAKSKTNVVQSPRWLIWLILVVTFGFFSPSLHNEFVNWDDDRNIYENQAVLNLNWENVKHLFTSDVIGNYNPLSNLVLGIEHQVLEGTDHYHLGFHLTNVLLHLLCVFLVFQILKSLGFNDISATFATLLFALHPMRVESVTWITEIKDVLYGAFYFGSIYTYLKHVQRKKKGVSWWSWALFIIGLFAKIQMVVLPVSLVLIDYYLGKKDLIKSSVSKWMYFIPALAMGIIGVFMLGEKGSLDTNQTFSFIERCFIGSYSLIIYLIKSLVPFKLSPLYPYPPGLSIWHYLSAIPALLFLGLIVWTYLKEKKIYFFGLAFFFANIVLLLQVLGAGQGYLADRFTYVAYFGLFFIYGHWVSTLQKHPRFKSFTIPCIVLVSLIYGVMTFNQTKVWENSGTLWSHVLKYYTHSTLPYGNRANYYRDIGKLDLALEDYSQSIRLKPDNPKPYNSRAKLYFAKNEDQKALQDYVKALQLDPENAEYLINRGAAYAKLNDWERALADLNKGLALNPRNLNGYLNRSLVYQRFGQHNETLSDLKAYLELNPSHADIWYERGRMHSILGQTNEAIESFSRAISLEQKGLYYLERSKAFFKSAQWEKCRQDVQNAQRFGNPPGEAYRNALIEKNLI